VGSKVYNLEEKEKRGKRRGTDTSLTGGGRASKNGQRQGGTRVNLKRDCE